MPGRMHEEARTVDRLRGPDARRAQGVTQSAAMVRVSSGAAPHQPLAPPKLQL